MPKQTRQSITQAQKRALREWVHTFPKAPTHKQCVAWFKEKFNRQISQPTVSEILSDRYQWLDHPTDPTPLREDSARHRQSHWPDLEHILYTWQQIVEGKKGLVTGDLLIVKARQIWSTLPQYKDLPQPRFSQGWLSNFKARYKIHAVTQHGEAGSVPEAAEEEMRGIRTIAGEYEEDNIYNMDETGLYWKKTPDKGLATQSIPGVKREKARITLVLCCNSSGSDRFPIWFIGSAKTPRALRSVNIPALGGHWSHNKKAWMTTIIMDDWLKAFYHHIGSTRRVLLFLDNCSSHATGLEVSPPPANIRVQFLPPNSTSLFQPLDQGIIQNEKVYYRKQWLQFMLDAYEYGRNPLATVTVLHAIKWALKAWNFDVSSTTIYNCFRKSTIFQSPISLPAPPPPDLSTIYHQVERAGQIRDLMSLENFLNPVEEQEEDLLEEGDPLEQLLESHIHTGDVEDVEDVEEPPPPPIPTPSEALQSLQLVLRFKECQEDSKVEEIRLLNRLERDIQTAIETKRKQVTLDSWFRA